MMKMYMVMMTMGMRLKGMLMSGAQTMAVIMTMIKAQSTTV